MIIPPMAISKYVPFCVQKEIDEDELILGACRLFVKRTASRSQVGPLVERARRADWECKPRQGSASRVQSHLKVDQLIPV